MASMPPRAMIGTMIRGLIMRSNISYRRQSNLCQIKKASDCIDVACGDCPRCLYNLWILRAVYSLQSR